MNRHAAKKIGTQQNDGRVPAGKDDHRQCDPAGTRRHPFGPLRDADEAEVRAAKPAQAPPNMIASIRTRLTLYPSAWAASWFSPTAPQDQPGAGEFQKCPDPAHQARPEIDDEIMLKHDRPDHRNIGQRPRSNSPVAGGFTPR